MKDHTDMPPPANEGPFANEAETPCRNFSQVREEASNDPVLGMLWLQLFDDTNP